MKGANCPIKKALEIVGGKWTLYIVYQIGVETIRYGALKRKIEGISEKMFVSELKKLVNEGIVNKKSYPEIPPRVEYSLTDLGKELLPIIEQMVVFGMKNRK